MNFNNWRLKEAFQHVKHDIATVRRTVTDAIFSLSNEYTKLQVRIEMLENRLAELEANEGQTATRYGHAKSY